MAATTAGGVGERPGSGFAGAGFPEPDLVSADRVRSGRPVALPAGQAGTAAATGQHTGDLVDDWVAAPSVSAPSLGPGGRIAFVSDRGGAPALWIRIPADGVTEAVTDAVGAGGAGEDGAGERPCWVERALDTGPGHVRAVSWSPDGAWIAVVVAPGGGELHEVRVVRPDRPGWRWLAGGEPATVGSSWSRTVGHGASAAAFGPWTRDGSALVVCESVGSGLTHALLVDPASGRREHLMTGVSLVVCDVRAAAAGPGHRLIAREGSRGRRRLLLVDTATGAARALVAGPATVAAGWFSPAADTVRVLTNGGRDRVALLEIPIGPAPTGPERTLSARVDADLELLAVLPGDATAVLGWNVAGRSELTSLDLATGRVRRLPAPPREVVTGLLATWQGTVVLGLVGSTVPGELWVLETAPRIGYRCLVSHVPTAFPTVSLTVVDTPSAHTPAPGAPVVPAPRPSSRAARPPSGRPARLVRPRAVTFAAHDGLGLSGWLYRPPRARGPVPAFVYLHGGPEAQERPAYNPLIQGLLARGIAVLAPNVRGSTGYGRAFELADDGDGRFGAIADVASCVEYLVAAGIACPGAVGVGGRSYGGYLTLAALVRHPELFRVGVDICGMVDLASFYADTEPWIAAAAVTKYGDPEADRALLRELSPLHRMAALAAPLLVVHGENDTNVGVREAEQTVDAALEAGVECRYLLFEGEGHEVAGLANRTVFVRETVDWLSSHLGVRRRADRDTRTAEPGSLGAETAGPGAVTAGSVDPADAATDSAMA
jgi:dipeptidyl aminopeptidase/acylaminoacyl peptidase